MTDIAELKDKTAGFPPTPGVYLMKDQRGRVIYVGKAKALRTRVASYFQKSPAVPRLARLVQNIADIDIILTDTEKEALILENSLIKKYRPRYNVFLVDDKTYPYLCLTVKEPYPRLEIVRRVRKDGSLYFGPFSSAGSLRQTLGLIQRLFPLRYCRRADVLAVDRPCLNYQLGRCKAPCAGHISQEDYRALVNEVILFFKGKNDHLTKSLRKKMQEYSGRLEYETAAWYRDRLADVEKTLERQKMVIIGSGDQDVLGLATDKGRIMASMLFIRGGALLGSRNIDLGTSESRMEDAAESLISQYYGADNFIPDEVLLPVNIEGEDLLAGWLKEKKGRMVIVYQPLRGEKKRLVELAEQNARQTLAIRLRAADAGAEALAELQRKLELPEPPHRIECFDLSHYQGDSPVGAMVVMENGNWRKAAYRRYKIRTAAGQDDYAMMYEVIRRRLSRPDEEQPDLVLLDGGRGQVGMAVAAIKDLGIINPPALAGLAKGHDGQPDRVYLPERKNPVNFRANSPGLLLLMRVRDEAHRFARAYHRKIQRTKTVSSVLKEIPGVGEVKRKALLEHFGSVNGIKAASIDELAEVKGLNRRVAEKIHLFFQAGGKP